MATEFWTKAFEHGFSSFFLQKMRIAVGTYKQSHSTERLDVSDPNGLERCVGHEANGVFLRWPGVPCQSEIPVVTTARSNIDPDFRLDRSCGKCDLATCRRKVLATVLIKTRGMQSGRVLLALRIIPA
jgi:hypothetical protein